MGMIWTAGAIVWALAEATLFFIVPDVLVTAAAIRFDFRRGLTLALAAAGSASFAGLGMWFWGWHDAQSARSVMLMIPAIGPDLLSRAHREVMHDWAIHLVVGAITGVPYKLYAVEAGAGGISPLLFVPASFAARLGRFLLTVGLATAAKETCARLNKPRWAYAAWALGWVAVYATYFTLRAKM
jgi:membrane protein YqaA with SNARE-associated domain